VNVNAKSIELLSRKASGNKDGNKDKPVNKAVLIKIPPDLFAKTMKKQSRMICEAADNGQTSNISINSVVCEALKVFCIE
jgi:hypothetical protein